MEIYLLTATTVSNTKEFDVKNQAFGEFYDALSELNKKMLEDLHNFNDYREMDIYEQEEFVDRLLSGWTSESLNGHDITYDQTTLTYTRTHLYSNRMYNLSIEKIVVKM
jgi:arginyl-tRNA synthetase